MIDNLGGGAKASNVGQGIRLELKVALHAPRSPEVSYKPTSSRDAVAGRKLTACTPRVASSATPTRRHLAVSNKDGTVVRDCVQAMLRTADVLEQLTKYSECNCRGSRRGTACLVNVLLTHNLDLDHSAMPQL